jgi:hypothetical protein
MRKFYFLWAWPGGGWIASKDYETEEERDAAMDKKQAEGFTVTWP